MFKIGEKAIVNSEINWYNGREVIIKDAKEMAGVVVYWVAFDNIEFAVREENLIKN